jgi:hypothetical protein
MCGLPSVPLRLGTRGGRLRVTPVVRVLLCGLLADRLRQVRLRVDEVARIVRKLSATRLVQVQQGTQVGGRTVGLGRRLVEVDEHERARLHLRHPLTDSLLGLRPVVDVVIVLRDLHLPDADGAPDAQQIAGGDAVAAAGRLLDRPGERDTGDGTVCVLQDEAGVQVPGAGHLLHPLAHHPEDEHRLTVAALGDTVQ